MTRVGLRGITTRRLRTVLTALAIVLGVAMVSGAYTLTDTMQRRRGLAVELGVRRDRGGRLGQDRGQGGLAIIRSGPPFPRDTLDQVRAVPGVEKAVGSITDEARIVGKDGDVVGTGPYFGVGLDRHAGDLSPFKLKEGRFATGPGQVVIDAGTADREGYSIGDTIAVQARGPQQKMRVTGIGTFGDVDSIGTATFALFDLHAAQQLFHKSGSYTEILVGGPDSVRKQLSASLGDSLQVQTAAANDRFTLDGLKMFVKFLKILLLVFGGIAVFVGAFTIYNTLSITVAQRSRELALHAGPRRHPAPGPALGRGRGARDRNDRLGDRRGRRNRARQADQQRVRVGRHRPAVHEHGVQHADARSCRSRWASW